MKKLAALIIIGASVISMTGCGESKEDPLMSKSKEELVELCNELQGNYSTVLNNYNSLQAKLDGIYSDGQVNPGITVVGDGSGKMTLNSVNEEIVFDTPLVYPESSTVKGDGFTTIVSGVTISARDLWISSIKNNTMELEHSSGISGTISVDSVDYYMSEGTIRDNVISPWLATFTDENVFYDNIFINSEVNGTQGKCTFLIDERTATIKCGVMVYGQMAISYVFVYDGEYDGVKDEITKNLLNTITIYGEQITVE